MEKQDIDKLRELPIEGVAERLGLKVVRHRALCPYHDDHHPSLSFSVSKNTFYCFSCGAHGGVIDLAMQVLGKGFVETCQWLADGSHIILSEYRPPRLEERPPFNSERYAWFFEHPVLSPAARQFLFEERRLDPRVVRWCRLTSWRDKNGINWLQIPYFNMEGQLTGIQWRNLDYHPSLRGTEGVSRFRFPYGSRCHVYNLPVLKLLKPHEELWIAEGCSDCWALLSSGHKAIAIPSATLLKPSDLEPIRQLASTLSLTLNMYPDADAPGERLFRQLQSALSSSSLASTCGELVELSLASTSTSTLASTSTLLRHSLPCGCKDYSDCYVKMLNVK